MDKQIKEEKAQELFKLHYDELCDPDKKSVRNAIKNKTLGKTDIIDRVVDDWQNTISDVEAIAIQLHLAYEIASTEVGWKTQDSCKGKAFTDLPEKNKEVMRWVALGVKHFSDAKVKQVKQEEIDWLKSLFQGLDKDEFPLFQEQIQARLTKLNGGFI